MVNETRMKGNTFCIFTHVCCKSDWVKDRPHSLPFEPKNGLGTQSIDLSIPVSHSWYGLTAEPRVKCLNTREAYNLVSLSIPSQLLAVWRWGFFQPEIVSSSPCWIIFMEFCRAQSHFIQRAVFALEDGTQKGCRNTKWPVHHELVLTNSVLWKWV